MSSAGQPFFKKLGYFFAGVGAVNSLSYQPMKAYLEKTQTQLQGIVDKKEANFAQKENILGLKHS